VANHISVNEKTGNTSSISEEQISKVTVTVYIPALFWLKKMFQVRKNWNGRA